MLIYVVYLLTGALGGIIIGALGSGSSLAILPVLSLIFPTLFPEAISLQVAVATCMATLIIGSASGALSYKKSQLYDVHLIKLCLPGVIAGAIIAPQLAGALSVHWLRWYIGLLILFIAIYKLTKSFRSHQEVPRPLEPVLIILMSIISSTLSGLAGIALGILMIPFLSRYSDHRTVLGTNLMLAVPYAVIGSAGYIFSGLHSEHTGSNLMLGYVYLPAFLIISITMAIFPPIGLKLAKNVSIKVIQNVFYIYLLCIGIAILL